MQIYRKRYELLQLVVISRDAITPEIQLQYRKRYELLQPFRNHVSDISKYRYNTASGMSCCNFGVKIRGRMQGYRPLQYRTRYELLQPIRLELWKAGLTKVTIPQAVWAVATSEEDYDVLNSTDVTIPQAVWAVATLWKMLKVWMYVSYNTASGMSCCNLPTGTRSNVKMEQLQYRKRYELLQQLPWWYSI